MSEDKDAYLLPKAAAALMSLYGTPRLVAASAMLRLATRHTNEGSRVANFIVMCGGSERAKRRACNAVESGSKADE